MTLSKYHVSQNMSTRFFFYNTKQLEPMFIILGINILITSSFCIISHLTLVVPLRYLRIHWQPYIEYIVFLWVDGRLWKHRA